MEALEAILTRPTVPPVKMMGPGPDAPTLERVLRAAAAAPDHGKLVPYRVLVVRGDARQKLGELFAEAVRRQRPDALAEMAKQREAPLRAPLILVLGAHIDRQHPKVPVVEQIACTAAAGQNILLAAHALGFAAKWATGTNAYDPYIREGLGMRHEDAIVGFIYIGHYAVPHDPSARPDLGAFVREWVGPG
ncbi:MAG: nitroreductase [Geminicoccaceae bacterium]